MSRWVVYVSHEKDTYARDSGYWSSAADIASDMYYWRSSANCIDTYLLDEIPTWTAFQILKGTVPDTIGWYLKPKEPNDD